MASSNNNNTNKQTAWNVKEPSSTPNNNMKGRINLRPDRFDTLIKQQGIKVKVYRTLQCPNVKSVDGATHNIDCTISGCNGTGYIDRHPIETMAGIQTQALNKIQSREGWIDGNTVAMTFLTGIELQYMTLVKLVDFTDIFFERIKRSISNVDVLRFEAQRVNVVIDQNDIEYYEGIDFNIDFNGNIAWVTDRGPEIDVIYSIHYEAPMQFRAMSAMHSNRFTQVKDGKNISYVKMQEQWACAREHLVKRVDDDGNEIEPNKYTNYEES